MRDGICRETLCWHRCPSPWNRSLIYSLDLPDFSNVAFRKMKSVVPVRQKPFPIEFNPEANESKIGFTDFASVSPWYRLLFNCDHKGVIYSVKHKHMLLPLDHCILYDMYMASRMQIFSRHNSKLWTDSVTDPVGLKRCSIDGYPPRAFWWIQAYC